MGLGPNIEEEMHGPSQGLARALAQGPGPHFLLNIRSQPIQILQLPAFRPFGQLSSKKAKARKNSARGWTSVEKCVGSVSQTWNKKIQRLYAFSHLFHTSQTIYVDMLLNFAQCGIRPVLNIAAPTARMPLKRAWLKSALRNM